MMEYLTMLDGLKDTDPAAFAEAMGQLGIPLPPQEANGSTPGIAETSLGGLASEIAKMRLDAKDGGPDRDAPITIPGQKKPEDTPGVDIHPEPGFVLKTKRVGDGLKTFLNICQHEALAKPAVKKRLDEDGNEVEGMNCPMSIGPARTGKDKEGKDCLIFDMIVNPAVLEDCGKADGGKHKDFICQMGMQVIEGKHNMELDKRYKLPKIKYMGEVVPQRIQDRAKMPNIEEVSPSSSGNKTKKKAVSVVEELKPLVQLEGVARWSSGQTLQDACWDKQYVEPIEEPPQGATGFVVSTTVALENLATGAVKVEDVGIAVSPYKVQLTLPDHKPLILALPAAIIPSDVTCALTRPEGSTRRVSLTLTLPLLLNAPANVVDAGSKQWLVSQAMRGRDDGNPYLPEEEDDEGKENKKSDDANKDGAVEEDALPEDRFHLKLPKDVDQYTGVKNEGAAEEEDLLPEDRFHKADAQSSFHINQRDQSIKDKWSKHAEEKAQRDAEADPNVEYIDVDDFKAGGKYGPKKGDKPRVEELTPSQLAGLDAEAASVELCKAAGVVQAQAAERLQESVGGGLSSSLYSELL